MFLIFGGVWIFLLLFAISRKTVQMDDHCLYVSVFRRVVSIPFGEISSVTEYIGMKDRSVTVHFQCETPFGHSITFTPIFMFSRAPHPIVAELLGRAKQHKKVTNI